MTETAHVTPAEVVPPPPEAPAAPAAPPSAPQQAAPSAEDGLLSLFMELPRERDRLGALEDPSTRKLAREIADTVLPLLQDFIGEALTERGNAHHFRDWVLQQGFPARDAHIAELNERLLELEQSDPESPWDEETALLILEVAGMLKARCEADLAGNPGLDEGAKQELVEAAAKCDSAKGCDKPAAKTDNRAHKDGQTLYHGKDYYIIHNQ